jgi:hypothetical protein
MAFRKRKEIKKVGEYWMILSHYSDISKGITTIDIGLFESENVRHALCNAELRNNALEVIPIYVEGVNHSIDELYKLAKQQEISIQDESKFATKKRVKWFQDATDC